MIVRADGANHFSQRKKKHLCLNQADHFIIFHPSACSGWVQKQYGSTHFLSRCASQVCHLGFSNTFCRFRFGTWHLHWCIETQKPLDSWPWPTWPASSVLHHQTIMGKLGDRMCLRPPTLHSIPRCFSKVASRSWDLYCLHPTA